MTTNFPSSRPAQPITLAQIQEGERRVAQLEEQISNCSDGEIVFDLADQLLELANLSQNGLSPQDFSLVDRDIQDITAELNDALAEEEEPDQVDELTEGLSEITLGDEPYAEETKSASIESEPHVRKKRHSKGLLKRIVRNVGHLPRDVGRSVRKVGNNLIGHHPAMRGSTPHKVEIISHHSSHKLQHAAKKVGRFIVKHRKAIIIGAIIAAAVTTGVILVVASGSATVGSVAGGLGAAGAGMANQSGNKTRPTPSNRPHAAPTDSGVISSSYSRVMDPNRIAREAAMREAEVQAKQVRYPEMVYRQRDIERVRSQADAAFDQFKTNVVNSFDEGDIHEAIAIGTEIYATAKCASAGPVGLVGAAFSGAGTAYHTKQFVSKHYKKIDQLYAPVGEKLNQLHQMENQNIRASLNHCEKEGYRPRLEFHPDVPNVGPDRVVLVDKNNPNPHNNITVVMPE